MDILIVLSVTKSKRLFNVYNFIQHKIIMVGYYYIIKCSIPHFLISLRIVGLQTNTDNRMKLNGINIIINPFQLIEFQQVVKTYTTRV